ncbi:Metallo-hydrolase/oxidoreductase [Pleurotus eryngii]|uniref:Metallo-hydrolase/oxidoreductase n=1 Tax=Pleurotus eryngii TaxID=5323 RepID=A0A9P6DH20_PLEER|nr:Metallo-hydrolase/oxidoreductase [Pleurotus eryngii]
MCRLEDVPSVHTAQAVTPSPNSSVFIASRLTPTTFLIKEYDDIYSEQPHMYAKLIQQLSTIIILDTGCGGNSSNPDVEIKELREFLETVGIEDNGGGPLNEGRRMKYIIILSHCHYDHILAVGQFSDSVILASGYSPEFLQPSRLPVHSLCQELGIETPSYSPTLVDHMHRVLSSDGKKTSMTIMHTPGHTPDELAVYDGDEKMLYVGDTLYENAPIIFPKEGSIIDWMETVDELISFVGDEESQSGSAVKINAGHETAAQPALEVLTATKAFMEDVLRGREAVQRRWTKRGEETVMYEQDGKRFSLICPERLVVEARR